VHLTEDLPARVAANPQSDALGREGLVLVVGVIHMTRTNSNSNKFHVYYKQPPLSVPQFLILFTNLFFLTTTDL
jgi:hypothetical protein